MKLKTDDRFSVSKQKKNGRHSHCKQCVAKAMKKWRKDNEDRSKQWSREYYRKKKLWQKQGFK